jgi:hypothetical protein
LFEGFADYTIVATTEIFDNNGDYRGATERKDLRLLKEHLTPDKYQSWLGELRRNMGNYIPFLYVFAPRLVGMKDGTHLLRIGRNCAKAVQNQRANMTATLVILTSYLV